MSLHERILAATHRRVGHDMSLGRALRAVVELHAPLDDPHYPGACSHCPADLGHPCKTVRAIARELGIEVDDRG